MLSAVPGLAQSSEERLGEIEQQIKDLNTRIAAQRGERVEIQSELATAESRMAEVRSQLADAEGRLLEVETSIANTEELLADIERQVADLKRQLAHIRLEVRDTRELVRERAVELYMEGGTGFSSLVFSTADVSEVELGLQYAEEVVADSEALINSLEVLRFQEEQHQEAVEARQAETEELLAGLEARDHDPQRHSGYHRQGQSDLSHQQPPQPECHACRNQVGNNTDHADAQRTQRKYQHQ